MLFLQLLTLCAACFSVFPKKLRGVEKRGSDAHTPWNIYFHTSYEVETYTRDISQQKMSIDDIIPFVT